MDISELDRATQKYFAKGLADSTQKTYGSRQRRYLRFCQEGGFQAVPTSEAVICHFTAHLAEEGLRHKTIKVYLAGIRFLHISEGRPDPFAVGWPRLHYTLRGIKRCEAEKSSGKRERLPISPPLLRKLKSVWETTQPSQDSVMLWAACCLAFFGFLRTGEMTVPSDSKYDPSCHLSFGDIAVDNPKLPSVVRVTIKQSKTDPFRQGIDLFLGKTDSDLCPVAALLGYLFCRGRAAGPLFLFRDGRMLTRPRFVAAVRAALAEAGVDESKYGGHSFRIGAATTAAAKGFEDSVIKTLGRWRSVAYLDYIRVPRSQLANYSRLLCA